MLSQEILHEIEHECSMYPYRQAACIDALKIVQQHHRWISDESIKDIARTLDMSPAEVDSVATFYNGLYRKQVGRHVIRICDSVSCWIMGYEQLRKALETKLGVGLGQTTKDGRFTLIPVQCLGDCDHAPSLMIDDDLHRNVNPETLEELLGQYE